MGTFKTSQILRQRDIFSGIQPTGVPHLGNYVGALRQWVQLQHQEPPETKLIYSVVDLHAITTPQHPEQLKRWKREALAALLAIGIDPDRSTLFTQSSVSALENHYNYAPYPVLPSPRSRHIQSLCGF